MNLTDIQRLSDDLLERFQDILLANGVDITDESVKDESEQLQAKLALLIIEKGCEPDGEIDMVN